MNKNNRGFSSVLIIIIVIIVLGLIYVFIRNTSEKNMEVADNQPITNQTSSNTNVSSSSNLSKCGFLVTFPVAESSLSFPLQVNGKVDNSKFNEIGCRWQMFEGQAGTAQLYYQSGNEWKSLGVMTPISVMDSYATSTTFSFTLNFNNGGIGLSSGTPLKIIFTEENAAAIEPSKTLELPITLK